MILLTTIYVNIKSRYILKTLLFSIQVLAKLSIEVKTLRADRQEVQQHLLRMEAWSENLSFWRAHIQSIYYHEEEDILQVR